MEEVRVEERYAEHEKSVDKDGVYTNIEIIYLVFNVENEDAAIEAVMAAIPKTSHELPLDSVSIESRENEHTFKVRASYHEVERSLACKDDSNEPTVSFDCGGGTLHRTHALSDEKIVFGTRKAGNAIRWNGKSGSEMEVAGVDIPTAQLRKTYIKNMKLSQITTAFERKVAGMVGKINSSKFKGWEAGEVMFLGMTYSAPAKSSTRVAVAFNFAIQPNESNAKVAGHAIGKKRGWDYAWALSKTVNDSSTGAPKLEVEAIYIDPVCEETNFKELGL